jgi:hypothetical protein
MEEEVKGENHFFSKLNRIHTLNNFIPACADRNRII